MPSEVVNVQVNATGNFSGVLGEVGKLEQRLKSLQLPKDMGSKFESGLKDVTNQFKQFQSLANKGIQTKGDFSKFSASARDLDNAIKNLKHDLGSITDKEIQIKIGNLPEVRQQEQEIQRLKKTYSELQKLGSKNIAGVFGEKETQNIKKLVGESKSLKPALEQAFSAIKSGDIDEGITALNKFETALNKIKGGALTQFQKNNTSRKNDIQQYINSARQELEKLGAGATEAQAKLNQFKADKFNQMKSAISSARGQLDSFGTSATKTAKEILEVAKATQNTESQLTNLQTQANYFFGLQNMISLFKRGLQDTIQTVKDLDKAMTDTAVVTDMTVSELWSQLPDYTKLANKLGATTQGAYETMTLYYQQGLNKQETFEIGEETMKMARIAGLDYADTTNMMTAALRGFNMELNQTSAKRVNDVYSELAAITASDTRELGLAMERTASIAHSANMDFGNTTAFLAQMIETTREAPENLGTAMKTIIARFQELKENPYQISEVEGEEVDFNRVDKALKSIGVDLMDNRDKFRDLDDVFMDISERWDGLSQTQQRYIATIAAGARQQSRFLAMVGNYDRLKELTDAAANSEGASDVQFSKTLESMEAKLNRLHNAWDQFTMGITNNELIKGATNILVDVLDVINKFETGIEHAGDKIGGVFGDIFKSITSFTGLILAFKGAGKATDIGIGMLGSLLGLSKKTGAGLFGGATGMKQAANMAQARAISNPIVSAIEKATNIITKTDHAFSNKQENTGAVGRQEFRNRQQQLQDLQIDIDGKQKRGKTFGVTDFSKVFQNLGQEEAAALYRNQKGSRKAIQRSFAEGVKGLNVSKEARIAANTFYRDLDYSMASGATHIEDGLTKAFDPVKVGQSIGGETGKEISRAALDKRLKIIADGKKYGFQGKRLEQYWRNEESRIYGSNIQLNDNEITQNTSRMRGFTSAVNGAGSAMMQLGMTFQSIGLEKLGGVLSTVGSGMLSLGMTVESAAHSFALLKAEAPAVLATLAAAAPLLAGAAGAFGLAFAAYKIEQKEIKDIRKSGKDVVDAYEDTTKSIESNLNKLNDFEPDWDKWAAGVDVNGNNVSLGTEEYQDYKAAVKEIIKMHPELVKGYNAEGEAIIDNNTALKEAIKLEKEREKTATKDYLDNGQKIVDRRNSTKRWQKSQQQNISASEYGRGAGTVFREKSDIEKDAQKVANAVKKLDGGKELLAKWNITFDELGNITADSINILRDHGGDLQNELESMFENPTEAQQKLLTKSNDTIAQLGQDFEGLAEVSKESFDALKVYATDQKIFDNIEADLVAPYQKALSRIAEQDLSWPEMQQAADQLGEKYQNLGGHVEEFHDIQEKVLEAQNQFAKDFDTSAYETSVEKLTAPMDEWIEQLRSSSDQADQILADWVENQKNKFQDITESALTLADAFNVMSGRVAAANGAYESWEKQNEGGDLYTAADSFKKMIEEVNDDVDNLGKGSNQWWTAAESLFGDDYVFEHSKDQIQKHVNQVEKYLEEGQEGVDAFMLDLRDNQLGKELDEDILGVKKNGAPYTIGDFIKKDKDGALDFTELGKAPDEAYSAIAKALGMSDELFTSLMNKARQFGDIEFGNVDDMRTALATADSTIVGQGSTKGNRNLYTRESDFRMQALEAGLRPEEIERYQKQLEETGTTFLKGANEINKSQLSKYIKDWGIDTGKYQTKEGKDRYQTTADAFIKYFDKAGYSKEEISQLYDTAGKLIEDNKEVDFNEAYKEAHEANADPAVQAATSIDGKVGSLLGVAESIAVAMGVLTQNSKKEIQKGTEDANQHATDLLNGNPDVSYSKARAAVEEDQAALLQTKNELEIGQANFEKGSEQWNSYQDQINKINASLELCKNALDTTTKSQYEAAQAQTYISDFAKSNGGQEALRFYNENGLGNTDLQSRNSKLIDWGEDPTKNSNFENAQTWGFSAKDLKNQVSSFLSTSMGFGEGENAIEIAFTPIIDTGDKLEMAAQEDVQSYLDQIVTKATDEESGEIDIGKLMELDQEGMEINGQKLHDLIMGAFSGENATEASNAFGELEHILSEGMIASDTSFAGLKEAAQDANTLGQNLSTTGIQGQQAAEGIATSFIKLNSEGLSQLDASQLDSVISALGITREELSSIASENHIDLGIETDTTELDQTTSEIENEENKEHKIGISVEAESGQTGGLIDGVSSEAKQAAGQTITIPLTANAFISNPEEVSENSIKTKANIPESIDETVKANITMEASVSSKGLSTKMQKEANSAAKGLKVKAKTNATVSAKVAGTDDTKKLSGAIKEVKSKSVNVKANVSGEGNVSSLRSEINNLPTSKTVTLTTKKVTIKEERSGATGINNTIKTSYVPQAGSVARGKYGTIGPKDKGGLTLTGEEGFEIAWLPSENRSMILGTNGPQMVNLPNDAVVWTNEQSKKIMKQKAVPAGSHRNMSGRYEIGGNGTSTTTTTTKNNSKTKTSKSNNSNNKDTKKNNKETKKIIQKAGKINSWWWNMTKKVEATQRKIDKLNKQTEKLLKQVGSTLFSVSGTVNKYIGQLKKQISLNTTMKNKADSKLNTLDKGKASKATLKAQKKVDAAQKKVDKAKKTKSKKDDKKAKKELKKAKKELKKTKKGVNYSTVSYDVTEVKKKKGKTTKTKKTKKSKINLAPYIYFDTATGAYQVDYKKINKKFGKNKSKAKGVMEAAEKKIDDYTNKRNTAEDNIEKAQEALETLGQELYETFHGWEISLTKIWNITQRIEESSSRIERLTSFMDLLDAQLSSGLANPSTDFIKNYTETFNKKAAASVQKVEQQMQSIELNKLDLQDLYNTNANVGLVNNLQSQINSSLQWEKDLKTAQSVYNSNRKAEANYQAQVTDAEAKAKTAKQKYGKNSKQYKAAQQVVTDAKAELARVQSITQSSQTRLTTLQTQFDAGVKAGTLYDETGRLDAETYIKNLKDERDVRVKARDFTKFKTNADGTISIDFNTDAFRAARESSGEDGIDAEMASKIQDYVQSLVDKTNELNSAYAEATNLIAEQYQSLAELKQQWSDYGEQLLSYYEDQQSQKIDELKSLSEAINQSLQDLLDKVKKDLDNRRQEQDNEKKEQSISKKQQRLATLRSNTSGGNQVEIAQLQQEIAEEQQEYERTLEDQLLDKLSEQADAAAKQRERQIELQEAVLQATNNAAEVNKWMNEPEKYQEEIRQAFYESKGYDTLTAAQQAQLEVEFNELFNGISTNQQNQQTIKTAIDLTAGQIGTLRTSLEGLAKIVADSAGNASIVEPEGSTIEVPDGATDPNPYKEEEDKSNADTESAGLDRANAVLKYQAKLLQAESNKKTSFNEIKSTVAIGHDAGLGTGTVLQDLAKTGGLTWKQILTALKGNYSKYRLALTYTSDAFKKAYDAVYGSGTYKKNRKVALDSKGKYTAYKFASGGIADYTGPAWLDGTPSKPELVLNAQDTKNFLALRDILGSTMGAIDSTNNSVGDISYEININVDHINNDYDVDKIAARIKKDIVKDASYRNVTQARKFR